MVKWTLVVALLLSFGLYKHWDDIFNPPDYASITQEDVVIYTTSWCGYCKKTRAYLDGEGIIYKDYDIEKSAEGKRQYDALGGKGVPLVIIGEARFNGYTENGMRQALAVLARQKAD